MPDGHRQQKTENASFLTFVFYPRSSCGPLTSAQTLCNKRLVHHQYALTHMSQGITDAFFAVTTAKTMTLPNLE